MDSANFNENRDFSYSVSRHAQARLQQGGMRLEREETVVHYDDVKRINMMKRTYTSFQWTENVAGAPAPRSAGRGIRRLLKPFRLAWLLHFMQAVLLAVTNAISSQWPIV